MCGTCGCGSDHHHHHEEHHHHGHDHPHDHHEHHPNAATASGDAAEVERRRIRVEQDLLQTNDRYANANRARLDHAHTLAINLMSSPGSGKTTLLCRTLERMRPNWPLAVIEGDQQTDNDAARIRQTGVPAFQVNTGKGCHLDAKMLMSAFDAQPLPAGGFLFVENVGNLVCPAAFDLGEHRKVVVVSVTEGEDKPLKYPDMFAVADLILVNKIDLLPYLSLDLGRLRDYTRQVNSTADILHVSATTQEGFEAWVDWLDTARNALIH